MMESEDVRSAMKHVEQTEEMNNMFMSLANSLLD
jgi:hypothetical protein